MRITYQPEVDAAYIYLIEIDPGRVATTVNVDGDALNLDFDRDGRLLGIEVLGASRRLPSAFLEEFANRGATPS